MQANQFPVIGICILIRTVSCCTTGICRVTQYFIESPITRARSKDHTFRRRDMRNLLSVLLAGALCLSPVMAQNAGSSDSKTRQGQSGSSSQSRGSDSGSTRSGTDQSGSTRGRSDSGSVQSSDSTSGSTDSSSGKKSKNTKNKGGQTSQDQSGAGSTR
jgi:hypothetical protein